MAMLNTRALCLRCWRQYGVTSTDAARTFSSSALLRADGEAPEAASEAKTKTLDPQTVHTPQLERRLIRTTGQTPVGSRRRRAALRSSAQVPFEELPYQCFQEARKILSADRAEKIEQINEQRKRLEKLREKQVEPQNEFQKERRIASMAKHLEELKIFADINDPTVKKRFEDGLGESDTSINGCAPSDLMNRFAGDMNKPIYRYLADREWRSYRRALLIQRITQMSVVPDVLPTLDPTTSVDLSFGKKVVQPGEFVDSRLSEQPPKLKVQVYDKGERLVTVAVISPDVPNVEKDSFDYRCHFLACNIAVSPTTTSIPFRLLSNDKIVLPWLAPWTQRGAPYQRLPIFVFEQDDGQTLDVQALQGTSSRENFIMRSFADRHRLRPIGVNMFRSHWDEGTAEVMQRAGVPGHDVEFKRKKIQPLPYKKLPGYRYR